MTFCLSGSTTYWGWEPSSTSTPSLLLGRSRTCPIDAMTLKSRPRYLLMVFALAGDSTTTRALAMKPLCLRTQITSAASIGSRSVKPDEQSAGEPPHQTGHFEGTEFPQQVGRPPPGQGRQFVE